MTATEPDNERRTEWIQIRATKEEKAMIREDAKRDRRTMSQYLIELAHKEHSRNRG